MKTFLCCMVRVVAVSLVTVCAGCDHARSWGWKLATDPDDVMDVLNGSGAYQVPVKAAKVTVTWTGTFAEFHVFYQPGVAGQPPGGWRWKLATDPGDVLKFLNGQAPYTMPVRDAKICVMWKDASPVFYVFYEAGNAQPVAGTWGWKLAPDANDVMTFLNGRASYEHPVTIARIATLQRDGQESFYVFYQRAASGGPIDNWTWRKATDPDDVVDFLSGTGAYQGAVKGAEVGGVRGASGTTYYVFSNQGTRIWLQRPVAAERAAAAEAVTLFAFVTSDSPTDDSQLQWASSLDGPLGSGPTVTRSGLSVGTHTVVVTGYGDQASTSLRVFTDLWALYQVAPSPAELDRVRGEYAFTWVDGSVPDERWQTYDPAVFDQSATNPSRLIVLARLDMLRHEQFSDPLPFAPGEALDGHIRTHTKSIYARLDCSTNGAGGGTISVNRNMSVWDLRASGTAANPNACKTPFPNAVLAPYVDALYLLVHESRHNEPDDPGHTTCNGKVGMDQQLDGGSGYAWSALYLMWVYKYGVTDPPAMKAEAKVVATDLLKNRFCTPPTSANPKVQAILNELLQN